MGRDWHAPDMSDASSPRNTDVINTFVGQIPQLRTVKTCTIRFNQSYFGVTVDIPKITRDNVYLTDKTASTRHYIVLIVTVNRDNMSQVMPVLNKFYNTASNIEDWINTIICVMRTM